MPGYDVQEVSKEVSRGQQWASGPVGQTAAIRYHEVWFILGLFELIGTYGLCVGLCCFFFFVLDLLRVYEMPFWDWLCFF